jgi:hypothetical protein
MSLQFYSTPFIEWKHPVQLVVVLFLFVLCSTPALSLNARCSIQHVGKTPERKATVAKSRANAAAAVTEIRHVKDEAWLERLEIEVKNISTKPIFYLQIEVGFPDLVSTELDGVPRMLVMPLSFGRRDLLQKGNSPDLADVAIQPGESYVFKIPEQYRRGLQDRLNRGIVPDAAVARIGITVDSVSFGDGMGFRSGVPYPFVK